MSSLVAVPGNDVTLAIMAGGKSSRMGIDKSFAPFLGAPLIRQVLAGTAGLCSSTLIVTNDPLAYAQFEIATASDSYEGVGPLAGLHAALLAATSDYILAVACDMPWLNRALLVHLLSLRDQGDAVVPRWNNHFEPLHAVYSQRCLAPIEDSILAGRLKTVSFYDQVAVVSVGEDEVARFDPRGRSFSNVNTPDDLLDAERVSES